MSRVRVDKILVGGEALAHGDDGSVLVSNGVPEDILDIGTLQKRRGMARAELSAVVQASASRVPAPCLHAQQCGGCALQFLDPSQHADLKSKWVKDAFQASWHASTQWLPAVDLPAFARRRRIRFWHQAGKLGLRRRASHDLIALEHCLICEPSMDAFRLWLQAQLEKDVQSIQMCLLSDGMHVILESHRPQQACDIVWPEHVQAWWRCDNKTTPLSEKVTPLHDDVDGLKIRVGPDDFIQNDAQGNQVLVSQLKAWSDGASFIVDLFSGVGNLSLPLARTARVLGAEMNVASVRAAQSNAKRLKLSAEYRVLNLFSQFNVTDFAGADVLILDPPRRGAKEICKKLGYLMPKKIIMVSCDIASGARDGKMIEEAGYRLSALKVLDLFSYAGHVEALSLWERAA
ncbi:MAG: methyltransferase [Mariprofundaceae bacterium]|nr:methyltransferase [Mariprofundaceae bacterium]